MNGFINEFSNKNNTFFKSLANIQNKNIKIYKAQTELALSAATINTNNETEDYYEFEFKVKATTINSNDKYREILSSLEGSNVNFTVGTSRVGESLLVLADTTPEFIAGIATLKIRMKNNTTWVSGDTVTIKIASSTICGFDIVDSTGFVVNTLLA
jgi:hypothetical protein